MRKQQLNLPFKIGQSAELRTFEEGFRGAWFLCKIKRINQREQIYTLVYPHFPDEKPERLNLYQLPCDIEGNEIEGAKKEMMLRPCFPTIYSQKKMPRSSEMPEVAVIVDKKWKVGDLVDWWKDNCFWSGTIIQLLGNGKAKIQLKPPPAGEGELSEILLKDVRPSLDWSLENGWTLPTQDEGTGRPCARLIRTADPVQDTQPAVHEAQKQAESLTMAYLTSSPSSSSDIQTLEKMQVQIQSLDYTALDEAIDAFTLEKSTSADCVEKSISADCGGSGSADRVPREATDMGAEDKSAGAERGSGCPMELDGAETSSEQSPVRIHKDLVVSCPVKKLGAGEVAILPHLITKEMAVDVGTQEKTPTADGGSGNPMELDGTEQSPVRIHKDLDVSCPVEKLGAGEVAIFPHLITKEMAVDMGTQEKTPTADGGNPMELDGTENSSEQSPVRINKDLDVSCPVKKSGAGEVAILPHLIAKDSAVDVGTQEKTPTADGESGKPMELNGTETKSERSPIRIHVNDRAPLKKVSEGMISNYEQWNTAEAASLGLEACLTRIKLLKSLVMSVASGSDAPMPDEWESVETNAVSSRPR